MQPQYAKRKFRQNEEGLQIIQQTYDQQQEMSASPYYKVEIVDNQIINDEDDKIKQSEYETEEAKVEQTNFKEIKKQNNNKGKENEKTIKDKLDIFDDIKVKKSQKEVSSEEGFKRKSYDEIVEWNDQDYSLENDSHQDEDITNIPEQVIQPTKNVDNGNQEERIQGQHLNTPSQENIDQSQKEIKSEDVAQNSVKEFQNLNNTNDEQVEQIIPENQQIIDQQDSLPSNQSSDENSSGNQEEQISNIKNEVQYEEDIENVENVENIENQIGSNDQKDSEQSLLNEGFQSSKEIQDSSSQEEEDVDYQTSQNKNEKEEEINDLDVENEEQKVEDQSDEQNQQDQYDDQKELNNQQNEEIQQEEAQDLDEQHEKQNEQSSEHERQENNDNDEYFEIINDEQEAVVEVDHENLNIKNENKNSEVKDEDEDQILQEDEEAFSEVVQINDEEKIEKFIRTENKKDNSFQPNKNEVKLSKQKIISNDRKKKNSPKSQQEKSFTKTSINKNLQKKEKKSQILKNSQKFQNSQNASKQKKSKNSKNIQSQKQINQDCQEIQQDGKTHVFQLKKNPSNEDLGAFIRTVYQKVQPKQNGIKFNGKVEVDPCQLLRKLLGDDITCENQAENGYDQNQKNGVCITIYSECQFRGQKERLCGQHRKIPEQISNMQIKSIIADDPDTVIEFFTEYDFEGNEVYQIKGSVDCLNIPLTIQMLIQK